MKKDNLKRDINLFEAIFKDKTKKTRDIEKDIKKCVTVYVAVLLAAVVILGGYTGFLVIRTSMLEKETAELATEETKKEIEEHRLEKERLEKQNADIEAKIKEFNASTKLLHSDIMEIAKDQPANIVITALSYNEGVLKISCEFNDKLMGPAFAQRLKDTGRYDKVECSSVTVNSKTNVCSADIIVTFKGAADKEGKKK